MLAGDTLRAFLCATHLPMIPACRWVLFVDERNVPLSSDDSNYKAAHAELLRKVGAACSNDCWIAGHCLHLKWGCAALRAAAIAADVEAQSPVKRCASIQMPGCVLQQTYLLPFLPAPLQVPVPANQVLAIKEGLPVQQAATHYAGKLSGMQHAEGWLRTGAQESRYCCGVAELQFPCCSLGKLRMPGELLAWAWLIKPVLFSLHFPVSDHFLPCRPAAGAARLGAAPHRGRLARPRLRAAGCGS